MTERRENFRLRPDVRIAVLFLVTLTSVPIAKGQETPVPPAPATQQSATTPHSDTAEPPSSVSGDSVEAMFPHLTNLSALLAGSR